MDPISTTLWINDGRMEEAATFYTGLLGGRETGRNDYGPDAGTWAGTPMVIRLELLGASYALLSGGDTRFTPNESVSFAVGCDTQEEVDHLWDALAEDGEPGPCGWIKDRFGFSWEVTPKALYRMLDDPDPAKVQRVTAAMLAVDRRAFSIEELQAAYDGRG